MTKPQPSISSTLYLGLLFAQEDAGGRLIPGSFSRHDGFFWNDVVFGRDQCGCIHGAALLYGGRGASDELDDAGITAPRFDWRARRRIALGRPVTVDSTLLDCGVEVKEE